MKTRDYLLLGIVMFSSLAYCSKNMAFTNWSTKNQSSMTIDTTHGTDPSLQLHYHFLNTTVMGSTVMDLSGHERTAQMMNGAHIAGDSTGGIADLSGMGYLQMGINTGALIGSLNDFSICCWVNPNSLNTWSRVFDFGNNTENYMFLTTNSSQNVSRFAFRLNNQEEQALDGAVLTIGKWSHLAIVIDYDSILGVGIGKFFIDGILVSTNAQFTYKPSNLGTTQQNFIGKSLWTVDPGLDGSIADFRIYSRPLSSMDINDLIGKADSSQKYMNPQSSNLLFKAKNDTAAHLSVQSNVSWTVQASESWLHVQPASGSGNAEILVSVDDNPSRFMRSAQLVFKSMDTDNQIVAVYQSGDSLSTNMSYTVHVPEYGQLSWYVSEPIRNEVTSLVVTGNLNANDLNFLRNYFPNLQHVDLSGTQIQWNTINSYVFEGWTNLKTMVLPETIVKIDYRAFSYCTSLTSVNIPASIERIETYAFLSCGMLSGILNLPSGLVYLGYQAFDGTGYLTCRSLAVNAPMLESRALGNIYQAYIPANSFQSYTQNWPGIALITGDTLLTITVDLAVEGTLGEAILQQVDYLRMVNRLIVKGPINTTDYALIKNSMPNLISLDLSKAISYALPDYQFASRYTVVDIILPEILQSIGYNAFENCYHLEKIELPATLTTIRSWAFINCHNLKTLVFPASLNSIGEGAFYQCYSLDSIRIPQNVTQILYSTFYRCTNLRTITLPNQLAMIGENAFYYCPFTTIVLPESLVRIDAWAFQNAGLKSIVLPTNLEKLSAGTFYQCPLDSIVLPAGLRIIEEYALACQTLRTVRCLQPTPPTLPYEPFTYLDKNNCVLYVPHYALIPYKLAPVWYGFTTITSSFDPSVRMPISGNLHLSNNLRPFGQPDVSILRSGSLSVGGSAPFGVNNLQLYNSYLDYWDNYGWVGPGFSPLVVETPAMTANSVRLNIEFYSGRWYYLSFPFNVRVSDIQFSNNALFSIRKYDGAVRATNGIGSSWKNMTQDSVLKAGIGYVFQCNTNSTMRVQPMDSTAGRLLTSGNCATVLHDFPAESVSNSSWNYVGNPYPAYFDTRFIDFTAPITVWNRNNWSYQALSLIDDRYALLPFEGFFVQKPLDVASIGFLAKGRQITSSLPATVVLRSASDRQLLNLTLSDGTITDKCRVVINPSAKLSYEMTCDASKFMSTRSDVDQLYSLDAAGIKCAINERPLDDGNIRLGFYAGVSGKHTLAAADVLWSGQMKVVLVDKLLGIETDLSALSYEFTSDKGTFDDRFILKVNSLVTNSSDVVDIRTQVLVEGGTLVLHSKVGRRVSIYNLNGVRLHNFVTNDEITNIPMAKGVYMVRVDGQSFKSVVF